jgi:hypothetical protein
MPQIYASEDLFKVTEKLTNKLAKSGKMNKALINDSISQATKDLGLEKIEGDCFKAKMVMFQNRPKHMMYAAVMDLKKFQEPNNKNHHFVSVFHKLHQLIIESKYKKTTRQNRTLRRLQALKKKVAVSEEDRLIGGVAFNTKNPEFGILGCFLVGVMKAPGASKVKSPYTKERQQQLQAYTIAQNLVVKNASIPKYLLLKRKMKEAIANRVKLVAKLKKNAVIESHKKPKDRSEEMLVLYKKTKIDVKAHFKRWMRLKKKSALFNLQMKTMQKNKNKTALFFKILKKSKNLKKKVQYEWHKY